MESGSYVWRFVCQGVAVLILYNFSLNIPYSIGYLKTGWGGGGGSSEPPESPLDPPLTSSSPTTSPLLIPSKHLKAGHHQPSREALFKKSFTGWLTVAQHCMLTGCTQGTLSSKRRNLPI